MRFQNAKLDFTDLSLRPQFAAKIYELNGAINGLSSSRQSRSQVELDGRVDEFGLARIRGELNPFAPRNNTDINVVFRNVDMVPASPYTMKFAGYKVAEGKISLDLQYKIRDSKLEGDNKIVIDKLTLGERVDSPDAIKLPLQLAIAILKDSDGRIDLGLPVSGDLSDPQFSYGAIIWKAITNVHHQDRHRAVPRARQPAGHQRRQARVDRLRRGQREVAAARAGEVEAGRAGPGQACAAQTLGAGTVQRGGRWRGAEVERRAR